MLYHHDLHICWLQHQTWISKYAKAFLNSPFLTFSSINQRWSLFLSLKVKVCFYSNFMQYEILFVTIRWQCLCYCVKSVLISFSLEFWSLSKNYYVFSSSDFTEQFSIKDFQITYILLFQCRNFATLTCSLILFRQFYVHYLALDKCHLFKCISLLNMDFQVCLWRGFFFIIITFFFLYNTEWSICKFCFLEIRIAMKMLCSWNVLSLYCFTCQVTCVHMSYMNPIRQN